MFDQIFKKYDFKLFFGRRRLETIFGFVLFVNMVLSDTFELRMTQNHIFITSTFLGEPKYRKLGILKFFIVYKVLGFPKN
ncbi:hypothetical protein [Methanobacterium sp.]|jgi:hypothetical protein|uniref:hypothetical protein n=1 Tax=Methanobacterium sp. TaxID=2164 RepID=UPI0031595475